METEEISIIVLVVFLGHKSVSIGSFLEKTYHFFIRVFGIG